MPKKGIQNEKNISEMLLFVTPIVYSLDRFDNGTMDRSKDNVMSLLRLSS